MARPAIQASFNAGELAPALYARVDLQKYHSGAALLRNFYVDYRGGATTSPGSKYILQCITQTSVSRLLPFQASFSVNYVLVFEHLAIWFINNGVPVLEATFAISAANIGTSTLTVVGHPYSNGDRVYIAGIIGTLGNQLNGNYFQIISAAVNTFKLRDLNGNAVVFTGAYTSGGTTARVYTITSPYTADDLYQIKYSQDVNVMFLCHPNFAPYSLTLTSATSWALAAITFGSTVAAPAGQAVATTLAAGAFNYAYIITAVDANGQESGPSGFAALAAVQDLRTVAGTNTVTWTAVTGATSYNIYKAEIRSGAAVPAGSMFGFIGNCTGLTFIDSNIGPDFSQNYPIVKNPFSGTGVQSVTVTAAGNYVGLTVPSVSFSGGGGSGAAAFAVASALSIAVSTGGLGYAVNDTVTTSYGVVYRVVSIGGSGAIASATIVNSGSAVSGQAITANPFRQLSTSGGGSRAEVNLTFGVVSVGITSPGTGYGPAPAVVFSSGAAAATATLGAPSAGNPSVPGLFQQRLILAGPTANPRQFNMSQPGTYYNFNVTDPIQPDNAFQGFLVSGTLNVIQSMISQPQGLLVLSDQAAWLVNNGQAGSGIDAINATANAQVFSGAAGPQPIVAGEDVLYVQSKGSIVRNIVFNWNKQIYGGADISVQSSHLFYGYQILDWAWAEEPYKIVWAVRNDGQMLCLTFLKEQELIAWAHRDTQGSYRSVVSITETVDVGSVNAVYAIVSRTINGSPVKYVERFMEQYYPTGVTDAWQVDSGLRYDGVAALTFSGAVHLIGAAIVGVATDDTGLFSTFTATVSATGTFTIAAPTAPATGYTRVTAGLAFTPQLQTLPIDTGDPTIQGKMKFLPEVDLKVNQTLGLQIGSDANNLVDMDDLVVGNIGKQTNERVTDLVSGDVLQTLDSAWTVPGQYLIQQSLPYPASILGVIPKVEVANPKE